MTEIHGKLEAVLPTITVSGTAVTVTAVTQEWEKEFIFESSSGKEIAHTLEGELNQTLTPANEKQIIESVETVKTFVSELKFKIGFIEFTIKKQPQKTIKYYSEKK